MLKIMIDVESEVALFSQLIEQVKSAVAQGQLLPGSQLPSIRQLANDLDINNKTVAKAYRLLERDAIIETKGYRGTFVHQNARNNANQDLNAWVTEEAVEFVSRMRSAGATDSEIRIAFNNALNNLVER